MANNPVNIALKSATNVLRADEELEGEAPDPRRFMDLAVFYKCLDVLDILSDGEKIDSIGKRLALTYTDEFLRLSKHFVEPVLSIRGFQRFKPKWKILVQPKRTDLTFRKRGRFVSNLYSGLRKRNVAALRGMFTGADLVTAQRFSAIGIQAIESPQAALQAISEVHILGGMTRTKKYVREALKKYNIEVNEFSEAMTDVAEARELGTQIRVAETKRINADPADREQQDDLAAESIQLQAQVEVLAMESSSPASVRDAAVTEASKAAATSHATAVGKQLSLSPPQEDAMMVRGKSVIAAKAGSGKTRVLAGKVVYHIKELGIRPGQIIATSFSNKSAYELLDRIREYGGEGILPEGSLDGFGTTHSVSGKILGRFANMGYGKSVKQAVLSGGQQTSLIKMAMKQVELAATALVDPPVEEGIFDKAVEQRRQSLAQPQGEDPVDVAADPAESLSWKEAVTEVLDYYNGAGVNHQYANARKGAASGILRKGLGPYDLTSGQRWAMKQGFEDVGLIVNPTQSGNGVTIIRAGVGAAIAAGAVVRGAKSPFWADPANQWFNLGDSSAWVEEGPSGKINRISHKQVALQIGGWKANLVSPTQARDKGGVYAAAYAAYEWLKKNDPTAPAKRDQDDILIQASELLISQPNALEAMRSEKKFVLIDESQDLSKSQHLLFGLIAGYYDPETQQPNTDGSMTADTYTFIGDDAQAIYEFRGATPDLFIELSTEHGFDTKMLAMNYRSGSSIIDAANNLIANNTKQIKMSCEADPSRGIGDIEAIEVDTHQDGAELVAREIADLVEDEDNGFGASSFGIACRTNAELHAYVLELSVRGVPFRCPKVKLFSDKTSKAILNWMGIATQTDMVDINQSVLESYKFPNFSLDRKFSDHLERKARGRNYLDYLEQGGWQDIYEGNQAWRNKRSVYPYVQALTKMRNFNGSPAEALVEVLSLKGTFDPSTGGSASIIDSLIADARNDSDIMELLNVEAGALDVTDDQVRDAAMAPVKPLMTLLERYQDLNMAMKYIGDLQEANKGTQKKGKPDNAAKEDKEYEAPAVQLDTVHGWKGLEADQMYVPMAAGVFPHKMSSSEEAMASERRLAYVAITRGRDTVKIISPAEAHNGKEAGISEFVMEACIPVSGEVSTTLDDNQEVTASVVAVYVSELEADYAFHQARHAYAVADKVLGRLRGSHTGSLDSYLHNHSLEQDFMAVMQKHHPDADAYETATAFGGHATFSGEVEMDALDAATDAWSVADAILRDLTADGDD